MSDDVLSIGLGRINAALEFTGQVTGYGGFGPGRVIVQCDYDHIDVVPFESDDRSGSKKRSGSCTWQLEADRLYTLSNVADSSRSSSTFYVSTFGGVAVERTHAEFHAERARLWPIGWQKATEAAQAEIVRYAAAAERRRIENEALKELNDEKAAQIAAEGQPDTGLPQLTGTPKQIAYALSIRDAFAKKNPGAKALKTTTAKCWIENHRSALYR